MKFETVLIDHADAIATITLNRPDVLNAINNQMVSELEAALDMLEADSGVRVIIITGAGRAFSAGRDIKEISAPSHRSGADVWRKLESTGKPVIAAVNGLCYTGALSMLLCFDLVIAADTAVFADTHARFGMYHGGGATQRLRERVGQLHAKEILLTSRPITASDAERLGLVNRVVPAAQLQDQVMELAASIAANDPDAIRVAKYLVNEGSRWGSAVGFALEAREYEAQRRRIAAGEATIQVQVQSKGNSDG